MGRFEYNYLVLLPTYLDMYNTVDRKSNRGVHTYTSYANMYTSTSADLLAGLEFCRFTLCHWYLISFTIMVSLQVTMLLPSRHGRQGSVIPEDAVYNEEAVSRHMRSSAIEGRSNYTTRFRELYWTLDSLKLWFFMHCL